MFLSKHKQMNSSIEFEPKYLEKTDTDGWLKAYEYHNISLTWDLHSS